MREARDVTEAGERADGAHRNTGPGVRSALARYMRDG